MGTATFPWLTLLLVLAIEESSFVQQRIGRASATSLEEPTPPQGFTIYGQVLCAKLVKTLPTPSPAPTTTDSENDHWPADRLQARRRRRFSDLETLYSAHGYNNSPLKGTGTGIASPSAPGSHHYVHYIPKTIYTPGQSYPIVLHGDHFHPLPPGYPSNQPVAFVVPSHQHQQQQHPMNNHLEIKKLVTGGNGQWQRARRSISSTGQDGANYTLRLVPIENALISLYHSDMEDPEGTPQEKANTLSEKDGYFKINANASSNVTKLLRLLSVSHNCMPLSQHQQPSLKNHRPNRWGRDFLDVFPVGEPKAGETIVWRVLPVGVDNGYGGDEQ